MLDDDRPRQTRKERQGAGGIGVEGGGGGGGGRAFNQNRNVGGICSKSFFAIFPSHVIFSISTIFLQNDIHGEIKVCRYARFWALEYVSSETYLRGDIGTCPPPWEPKAPRSPGRRPQMVQGAVGASDQCGRR